MTATVGFFARRTTWLTTTLVLILCLLAFADMTYKAREDSWRSGKQSVRNITRLAETAIAREIELYNLSLQAVVDGVADPKIMGQEPSIRSEILFDRSASAHGLGHIFYIDHSGYIILDSKSLEAPDANIADRDFFKAHDHEYGDNGLYISSPFKARLDDSGWVVAMSRRVSNPDGSLKGVVAGFMQLDYLNGVLERASADFGGVTAMLRDDGVLVARSNFKERLLSLEWRKAPVFEYLRDSPEGFFEAVSMGDQSQRLYSYRRVAGTPLVITTGIPVEQLFRSWLLRTMISGTIMVLLVGTVLFLVIALSQELKKRIAAEGQAQALARTDALTNIPNRRMFDEAFATEWKRAARLGHIVSLVMIDIDHFKRYNDAFGHPDGDVALRRVAHAIQTAIRGDVDLVARYGGEEFAVIFNHNDPSDARRVAERIMRHVRLVSIPFPGAASGKMTVSCGVASTIGSALGSVGALIGEADRALYEAKRSGRNCFVISEARGNTAPSLVAALCG